MGKKKSNKKSGKRQEKDFQKDKLCAKGLPPTAKIIRPTMKVGAIFRPQQPPQPP